MGENGLPLGQQSSNARWDSSLTRIKIVGVGDGGCNCVRRVLQHAIPGVQHLLINRDIESLQSSSCIAELASIKQTVFSTKTTGRNVRTADLAIEESAVHLQDVLRNAQLVIIVAGMGGATGTYVTPYIAKMARESGAFTVGVVTTPFSFEGSRKIGEAITGVAKLRACLDSLIVIHNDRLLRYVDRNGEIIEAFKKADDVISQGVLAITEMLNCPDDMGVDFDDMRTILGHPGGVLMAVGTGCGALGASEATREAIANPLLNLSITGARGILFSMKGGPDMTLNQVEMANDLVAQSINSKARILVGASFDTNLTDDIHVTLIATGV